MKVLQNNRRFMTTQLRDRVFTISGGVDIVAFETPFKLLEQTGIVFNDEKFASLLCHELFCRNAPKRLMCNGATKRALFAVEGSQTRMWTSANLERPLAAKIGPPCMSRPMAAPTSDLTRYLTQLRIIRISITVALLAPSPALKIE